jgi:hypothetical protein
MSAGYVVKVIDPRGRSLVELEMKEDEPTVNFAQRCYSRIRDLIAHDIKLKR